MKLRPRLAMLGLLLCFIHISLSYASDQTAGRPCTNPSSGAITTTASDAKDDLLACVGGLWHSMIYGSSVPSGGVEAFNLTSCPSGWAEIPALAGRTIIGVGSGGGLTSRALYDNGGEEVHTMTIHELVPHNISFTFGASQKGGKGNGYAYSDTAGGSTVVAAYNKTSNTIGNGAPFNVMMPYYALLYCMKQ